MNKKKHRSKRTVILVCLMVALLTCQLLQTIALAADEVTVTATNFTQLYNALKNAEDGDVVGISGLIDIFANESFGFTDKHITIRRMGASSILRIQSTSISFQNITFDGNEIDAGTAFVLCSGGVTFNDCVFLDCLNSTGNGGAVNVINKEPTFENCSFDNNTGVQGGHMYVASGTVTIRNCTFTNGHALSDGGAIKNLSAYPKGTYIYSSIITGNSADKYGGGLSLEAYVYAENTKIYGNTATGGGADISKFGSSASLSMYDSLELEGLLELYQDEEFVPTGWVNDYDADSGVEFPSGNLTSSSVLMKLDYYYPPTEVVLDEASLGTADDGKVTGLESGKYYKVTSGEVVSYSKADGTLTAIESEASPLVGTEIVGLINGETYLVEEYTPPTPDPDPDPEPDPDPTEEPDPTPDPTETPDPNDDQDEEPNEEPNEEPTPDPEPTETPTPTPTPTETPGQDQSSNTNTNDNSSSSSTTNNNSSSTVNNYDNSSHSSTENNPSADANTSNSVSVQNGDGKASASQEQSIKIDLGNLLDEGRVQDDGHGNLTINVNVYVDSKDDASKADNDNDKDNGAILLSSTQPLQAETNKAETAVALIDVVKICLLFGIFICLIIRPVRT